MSPARLWLSIFLAGFAVCTGLLVQTLLTAIPYGDLARIGRISEYDFGWRIDPPQVAPELLRGLPMEKAEILVIGDSFSATHRWQSVLTKGGYGVATTHWDGIDEKLCDDFDDWLARSGFHGRLVIVESVERLLDWRLKNSRGCAHMKPKPPAMAIEAPPVPDRVPGFALNWNAQMLSGWLTARCTRAAIAGKFRSGCDRQTRARAVPDGCALFSNRRCDMALFLAADVENGEITPANVRTMEAFTQAHAKVPLLWMVIPNKTTTYVEPARSQDFVKALAPTGLGPDLFGFTQEQKTKMRDFYFPNDTHISLHGQLVLGERMLQEVRRRIGEPTKR